MFILILTEKTSQSSLINVHKREKKKLYIVKGTLNKLSSCIINEFFNSIFVHHYHFQWVLSLLFIFINNIH